jgi:L-amino acid N-acyltransferase YncA
MMIRDAAATDILAVTEIYNSVLRTTTAIYNDTPVTVDDRLAYWQGRVAQGYPLIVAVEEERVLGYATFGDFRSWPGYRFTVEGTIHIAEGVRGQGIGTQLLHELIARARGLGKHVMVAGVDSGNVASLRFLTRFGFKEAGCLREVGFKFDRYLDLCLLQLAL